jgi:hypothetical protein
VAGNDNDAGETPSPPKAKYVGPLNSVAGVRRELVRVYTEARRDELDVSDASKLANILFQIGRLIEGVDLETRLARLEAAANQPTWGR